MTLRTVVLLAALAASVQPRTVPASAQKYVEHVKFLASPELQGRGAGSPGLTKAAGYIEKEFKALGLKPAGEKGSYRQAFRVTTDAKPGPRNSLTAAGKALKLGADYIPLSFSSNASVKGPVVFAGYGISAPEMQYDDYAHLDVKDKIVLVLRHEPPGFHKDTGGKEKATTHHAQLVAKAINARNQGAKALVLVNGYDEDRREDELIRFGSVAGPEDAGVAMVQLKNAVADEWLKASGKSIAELQKAIDGKNEPQSFALPGDVQIEIAVDIQRERATVHNIAAYLPGKSQEYVVIGAHYDHLGLGNQSSLAPSQIGQVHPGADDNASGTAGLLELARVFAASKGELQRGILFLAFAGEEIGLLGSADWVARPGLPLENAVAMINMDMIGRLSNGKLYVGGAGTGSTFEPMLKRLAEKYEFKLDISPGGYSSSDHTSFVAKKVPVLFFFSGLHSDYHKPSDTWDKIDGATSARLVNLIADVAGELTGAAERPQFVKVEMGPPAGMSGGGGYGAYFGSIPDFGQVETGVKFADVRPGSPADKAGLKGGDILIQFGDKPIKNLYDFTFALRGARPGDVVEVKYLRDGKESTAKVTLERRR